MHARTCRRLCRPGNAAISKLLMLISLLRCALPVVATPAPTPKPTPVPAPIPTVAPGNPSRPPTQVPTPAPTRTPSLVLGLDHSLCFDQCALDDQVGGMDATLMNGATYTLGEGVVFDGVDDYVDLEDQSLGGPMTLAFCARWDALNSWSRVVSSVAWSR